MQSKARRAGPTASIRHCDHDLHITLCVKQIAVLMISHHVNARGHPVAELVGAVLTGAVIDAVEAIRWVIWPRQHQWIVERVKWRV